MSQVLTRAKSGDKSAEEELLGYLRVRFTYLSKRRVLNEDVEDIVHDACLIVLQKYRSLEELDLFEPWAYRILRNRIGSYLQKESTRRKHTISGLDSDMISPAPSCPDAPSVRDLIICLRSLIRANRHYARTLNLVHQGYRTEEICSRLGVRSSHLYVMLGRGRAFLRNCLDRGVTK